MSIAIVWDFDGTLIKNDSVRELIIDLLGDEKKFLDKVKELEPEITSNLDEMFANNANIWVKTLLKIINDIEEKLGEEFFSKRSHLVEFRQGVENALENIKELSVNNINHFIISAGLEEQIKSSVPIKHFLEIWACRLENPLIEIDAKAKVRVLKDISKRLNISFENFIYIGDGMTDIPALSFVKKNKGCAILVFDPDNKNISNYKDFPYNICTSANFSLDSELVSNIRQRCNYLLEKGDL